MSSGNWMRYLKKIKPYTIKKGIRYLKHYGPKEFWVRLCERMEPEEVPYGPWFENHKLSEKELEGQGYQELSERGEWKLKDGGRYYVVRNGSSLTAFRIPHGTVKGFQIAASHSDSPGLKLKENPEMEAVW